MGRKSVIFDLDGTLANVDHRTHLVRRPKPEWDEFFKALVQDTPNQWCVDLLNGMRQGFNIIILSGRPNEYFVDTKQWLIRHGIYFDELYCIGDKKNPDHELKRKWIQEINRDEVTFVVDDRQKVVDMWREEGFVCLQCAKWDEFKKGGSK